MMAPRDNVIWLTQQLPRASVSGKASTHENSTFHFHTSRADAQMRGFRFRLRAPCPQELSRKGQASSESMRQYSRERKSMQSAAFMTGVSPSMNL